MKAKLNIDFVRYSILGACNPQLAHQALELDQNVGLLLPCNVVVYETNEGGRASSTRVEIARSSRDAGNYPEPGYADAGS
jgi:uncharacterized protein (DUF302 family)